MGTFVNGRINYGDKEQTQNQAGFDFNTIGVTTGVDYRFRDNFVVGAAVGYSQIKTDFDHSAGHLDIDTWNGSLFGTYFSTDKFYVDAALNYGDSGYDSVRRIVYTDVGGTVDRTAKSDTDGMETSASLSAGYDFTHGAWTFGPHVGSDYYNVDVDEFRETGAGGLNMVVGDQNAQSFTLNAGGHLSYVFTPSWGVLIPHLRVDFVHEFEDSRELVEHPGWRRIHSAPIPPIPLRRSICRRTAPMRTTWSGRPDSRRSSSTECRASSTTAARRAILISR